MAANYWDNFTIGTEKTLSTAALCKEVRHPLLMAKPGTGNWARQHPQVDPSPIIQKMLKDIVVL